MKKILLLNLLLISAVMLLGQWDKVDLNTATLEELKSLPITNEQAEDIYDYRHYISFFRTIYDLRNIPSIDQETMLKLRPLVSISYYDDMDEAAQRREEIAYLIERYGSYEGEQEALADIWEDYLMTPQNLNRLSYTDIANMPNVSPLDAAAIIRRRNLGEKIVDYRDLRNTSGISYYGASNLRHYIYYAEDEERVGRLFVDYQLRYNDREYFEEPEAMLKELVVEQNGPRRRDLSYWGFFDLGRHTAEVTNKLRIRYENRFKAGLSYTTRRGEPTLMDANFRDIWDNGKMYVGWEDYVDLWGDNSMKLYFGNYRAAFGEGLVMENTDFYSARKTGYGFSKRLTGIYGDVSTTQQYSLRGLAFEWKRPMLELALFGSIDKKDALVHLDAEGNPTDEVFSLITMTNRFDDDELAQFEDHVYNNSNMLRRMWLAPRKDFVEEKLFGGNIAFSPFVGTHIGFSGYEAIYDKDFVLIPEDPIYSDLPSVLIRESRNYPKFKLIDSEIANLYSTKTDEYERDYRRVLGLNWRTVIGNTSFQGEYAELSVTGNELQIGDDPKAMVVSSYTQFENFNFIVLYRNYDLAFDNPYSRGFSEHPKFRNSLLDSNAHTLVNPLIADMYLNSAQAQAEEGVYFETRYRFHEKFTITRAYLDLWERKADSRKSVRFQGELEYRPIFRLVSRLRYKHQINRYDDDADRGVSKTDETTAFIRANLSNRDRIHLEYRYNRVWMSPYTYLANNPIPDGFDIAQGTMLIHGDYICVDYTHNFNQNMKIQGSFIFWDGHGISHWDWEDMEIDFMGMQGMKYWLTFYDRISSNLYLTLKYRIKRYKTRDLDMRAWWNSPVDGINENYTTVWKQVNSIRLQLDWKF
ncbi:MAG: helix-hairpin-helix domain-containing protein [Candidatus Cloacimonetes bacterium]|nr:helix-hairpin-helix domain-containing protein [Candidatus Cloacimonadota bacterium]